MVTRGILVCLMFFCPRPSEPPVWAIKWLSLVKLKNKMGLKDKPHAKKITAIKNLLLSRSIEKLRPNLEIF